MVTVDTDMLEQSPLDIFQRHTASCYIKSNFMDKIAIFIERLRKIDIDVTLVGNFPWIYIDTINGLKVKEKFQAEHGFTVAFLPIRKGQEINFTDIAKIFKLIRKYK